LTRELKAVYDACMRRIRRRNNRIEWGLRRRAASRRARFHLPGKGNIHPWNSLW